MRTQKTQELQHMYSKTRISSILNGLPTIELNRLVKEYKTDRYIKQFNTRDHLIAMVSAQLMGSRSLRELETAFNEHSHDHYHLRTGKIRRSTLSEANSRRDSHVFEALCKSMLNRAHRKVKKTLTPHLYLLDSTPISLKGQGFDGWTLENKTQRTQGLKVHMLYANDQEVPVYTNITAANVNDIEDGKTIDIEKGATYVFDKGYCDYNWWFDIGQQGAKFVTRFKSNAGLKDVEDFKHPATASKDILSDQRVSFKYQQLGHTGRTNNYTESLRQIKVQREGKGPLTLATNDFDRSADEIAALYKSRWDIELFFKWIKQNLNIKQYLGRTENAVRIQIFVALITYLLVYFYRATHGIKHSMRMLIGILSSGLFQRPETEYARAIKQKRRREKISELQGDLCL